MAKLFVSSGRRGRPLSIDPEKELHNLLYKSLPSARQRLADIRKKTSGVRDPALLGSEIELPAFIQTTIDVLADLKENEHIDYETLKDLKKNIRQIEQLGSKQERVWGRSLESVLTTEYEKSLDYFSKNSSQNVLDSNLRFKTQLESLAPSQRQKYFFSREYQDPATMQGQYQHVVAWVAKKLDKEEKEVSVDEAWAFLREYSLRSFLNK